MNNEEKCVKCRSDDLIRVPTIPGEGPHIVVDDHIMHKVPLIQIVCGACGYIEMWVEGKENLDKLREQYGKGK